MTPSVTPSSSRNNDSPRRLKPGRCRFEDRRFGEFAADEFAGLHSFAQHGDPVAHRQQLRQLAGRDDDRQSLPAEFVNQPVDFRLRADIDAAGRIVEQQQRRFGPQGTGNQALLLIAAAETADRGFGAGGLDSQLAD